MSLLTPFKHRAELEPRKDWEDLWQRAFDWDGDPFQALQSWLPKVWERGGVPRLNFGEDDGHYTLTLELPGLTEKDIKIQLVGNQLVVSGERKWEHEKKAKEYHRVECQYGSFRRAVTLPQGAKLDAGSIQARYDKGLLEIAIPKAEPTKVSEIPVKVEKT